MAEYIEREKLAEGLKIWQNMLIETYGKNDEYVSCLDSVLLGIDNIPAADVPFALWTDEPISGTEFMTHNQGQSGFEIHFRTDDKAKYEAVQDECRRQIDHAKPTADVRPVVTCADCKHWAPIKKDCILASCDLDALVRCEDFYCANGEKREES